MNFRQQVFHGKVFTLHAKTYGIMSEYITRIGTDDLNKINDWEYGDGRIFVFDETVGMDRPGIVRIDGIFVILCIGGGCRLSINDVEYMVGKDDVIIGVPEAVIGHAEKFGGLKFMGMFMSLDYAFKMLPLSVRGWNFKMFFEQNPKISLGKAEVAIYTQYYGLLKSKLADKHNPYRGYIVDALMQAFVFEFRNVFDGIAHLCPRPISSGGNIFNEFIEILAKSYPKPRSVAYYADRLSITAKYLSVVCKKESGKSASKIIDAYVLKDIKELLRNSTYSIKEISNKLAFPNTSFFGRYVKKHLGCTPNELRRKLNGVRR